ncbi:hypothetical protein GQ53DRAFT_802819 [Thozetella sp. PMI_491]|nr:hypothetical protein GQ53DRAFT_802819 [Thozetella sp. PMI_491]
MDTIHEDLVASNGSAFIADNLLAAFFPERSAYNFDADYAGTAEIAPRDLDARLEIFASDNASATAPSPAITAKPVEAHDSYAIHHALYSSKPLSGHSSSDDVRAGSWPGLPISEELQLPIPPHAELALTDSYKGANLWPFFQSSDCSPRDSSQTLKSSRHKFNIFVAAFTSTYICACGTDAIEEDTSLLSHLEMCGRGQPGRPRKEIRRTT